MIRPTSVVVAIGVLLATLHTAEAAPIHKVTHIVDIELHTEGGEVGPQAASIDYDFPYQSVDPYPGQTRNWSEAHASVGQGYVRVFDLVYNNGQYLPQRQEIYVTYHFDVTFSSPTSDPIGVIMNLELAGEVHPAAGSTIVEIVVGRPGALQFGEYIGSTSDPSQNGLLSSFVDDGSAQSIPTSVLSGIPVNQPVQFMLQIKTSNGYTPASTTIDFLGEGLHLATTGNVFTLFSPVADDIVVTSTDADIVDNVFHPAAGPSLPLLSTPLQGLLVLCVLASGSLAMSRTKVER